MRGKFRKKQGKIIEIKMKSGKIYIEGIQKKKQDGSKVNIPLKASNLQIIELNMDDKKRMKKIRAKEEKKMEKEKEQKQEKEKK